MEDEAPGAPEAFTICTPEALPCRAWATSVAVRFSRSDSFTDAIAPVTSLFRWTPYPMTTVSSSISVSSSRVMLKTLWLPTAKVWPLKPILSTEMLAPAGTDREKAPSRSVAAPILELPTTVTAAPMTGSPLASTTLPLMVRFWAWAPRLTNKALSTSMMPVALCSIFFNIVLILS